MEIAGEAKVPETKALPACVVFDKASMAEKLRGGTGDCAVEALAAMDVPSGLSMEGLFTYPVPIDLPDGACGYGTMVFLGPAFHQPPLCLGYLLFSGTVPLPRSLSTTPKKCLGWTWQPCVKAMLLYSGSTGCSRWGLRPNGLRVVPCGLHYWRSSDCEALGGCGGSRVVWDLSFNSTK